MIDNQPFKIHQKTILGLFVTVIQQICNGDLKHPLRKHITLEMADKYYNKYIKELEK